MANIHELSNGLLTIAVSEQGAELQSLRAGGREYLWQGDPAYWTGRSPWLFPLVGSAWQEKYRHEGKTYELQRHGFARDSVFTLTEVTDSSLAFTLRSSEATMAVYPFEFELTITYTLRGRTLTCSARVQNLTSGDMYFQIGGHPGLNYHDFTTEGDDTLGYIGFDRTDLQYILVGEGGCAVPEVHYPAEISDGLMPIRRNTFVADALIFQDSQIIVATLYDRKRVPQIRMTTDAPITAFWAINGGDAPYVCFEPWCGRCDHVGYVGEFRNRDYMNHLAEGESYEMAFTLELP